MDNTPDLEPSAVARAMWEGDLTAQRLGITLVEAALGSATVEMVVDERHLGGQGVAHGGVLFTLADVAMSYAGNASNIFALATGANISFVSAAELGQTLVASAVEHNLRGKAGIYDVTVRDRADDRLVATFRGNTLRVGGSVVGGPVV